MISKDIICLASEFRRFVFVQNAATAAKKREVAKAEEAKETEASEEKVSA